MIGPVVVGAVLIFGIAQSVLLLTIKPWSRRCATLVNGATMLMLHRALGMSDPGHAI
jgi:hypothetical protein